MKNLEIKQIIYLEFDTPHSKIILGLWKMFNILFFI